MIKWTHRTWYRLTRGLGALVILLPVIFVLLKVSGLVDWEWIWVFAPLWVTFVAIPLMFAVVMCSTLIGVVLQYTLESQM